jgi:glucan phosphoethanolaminetransferase (alkaline phosphatase superfamily)
MSASPPAMVASPPAPLHKKWRGEIGAGSSFKHFILLGGALFFFLMAMNTTLFCFVFAPRENFFFNLAAAMVVSWTLILTLYYVWAIYFYNINRGRTFVHGTVLHHDTNPNSEETLGLPPGTVRGTLALSVLVLAMAMMIASLAMPASMKESEVMIDHFEFLKTGFVMVIAFYFGTKSLEILRNTSSASRNHLTPPPSRNATADEASPLLPTFAKASSYAKASEDTSVGAPNPSP